MYWCITKNNTVKLKSVVIITQILVKINEVLSDYNSSDLGEELKNFIHCIFLKCLKFL